jgi:hypothetical protein
MIGTMLWNDFNPSVDDVRAVGCPTCGAVAGAPCVAMGLKPQKLHRAHVDRQYSLYRSLYPAQAG